MKASTLVSHLSYSRISTVQNTGKDHIVVGLGKGSPVGTNVAVVAVVAVVIVYATAFSY